MANLKEKGIKIAPSAVVTGQVFGIMPPYEVISMKSTLVKEPTSKIMSWFMFLMIKKRSSENE